MDLAPGFQQKMLSAAEIQDIELPTEPMLVKFGPPGVIRQAKRFPSLLRRTFRKLMKIQTFVYD
jgi:hypothetical protein